MDSLGLTRLPGPALADFPPFLVRAPWWGGDLQTLRNYLVRWSVPLLSAERIYLPMRDGSGDRLVGSLHRPPPASGLAPGFTVLRLNLRGAGASRPHCRFQYYAGRSGDFTDVLAALPFELIKGGIVAIGYSLGANMLLKYLGEWGSDAPLKGAIAVSAPLDLAGTARRMMWRRNSLYQRYLLRHMRAESLGPGAEVTAAERAAI